MSNLFGTGQGKTVATQAVRANGLQVQASSYGMGLPIVYGRARVPGTLIWYGDFQSVEHDQQVGKGGGGGQNVSYTYSSSFQLALCESDGTLTLGKIWKDSGLVSLSDINGTFGAGGGSQAAWSHLSGAAALQYPFTAWIGCVNLLLGSSPNVPNFNFEVNGLLQFNPAGSIYDADPSAIVNDLMTSTTHGIGFQYLGSLTTFHNYCLANGIFLSPVIDQETSMTDVLDTLLQVTNSNTAWSNGKLVIIPYGDEPATGNGVTYTPPTTVQAIFTDKDYVKPVQMDRKPLADQYNVIRVEWIDPTNNYVTSVAEAKDEADISASIIRQSETIQAHGITNATLAQQTAQRILQRALYIRNTYIFTTTMEFVALEPGDVVTLSDSLIDLVNEPVRITKIAEQDNNELEITCEEFPAGVSEGATQTVEAGAGYVPNVNGPPDTTQPPVIFRAPQFLTDGDVEVWIGVCGSGANWGGANVLVSYDNVTYTRIGSVRPGCRYGTLTQALADSASDPDTVNSFKVALEGPGSLSGATHAEADNLATLMIVDQELMAYSSTILNGDGTYTLGNGYLRRQCYQTAHAAHAIGAPWMRVDDNFFRWTVDPSLVGTTVYIKLQAWNLYGGGLQSEASLTATTYVVGAAEEIPDTPPVPTNLTVYPSANGNLIVWENTNPAAVDITSVEYSTDNATWNVLGQVQGTHYTHTFTGGNATYYYRVRSRSAKFIWSAYTTSVSSTGGSIDHIADGSYQKVIAGGINNLTARGNCVVTSAGATVSKVGGSSAWDSDAYSTQGYLNGCFISLRAAETTGNSMFGLSSNPSSTPSYTKLDFGLYLSAGGIVIYESGNNVFSGGSYIVGDAFEIRYDGVTVRYFHNGALIRAVRAAGKTLYPAVCQYTAGAVVGSINFGPASYIGQVQGSYLDTTPWVIATTGNQGNFADIGSVQPSAIYLGGIGGTPLGPYGTSEPLWIAYGGQNGPNGGWNNNGDLYGIDPTKTYRSSVWFYLEGAGTGAPEIFVGWDNTGHTNNIGGTPNANPYAIEALFSSLTIRKWYLAVAILHGSGFTGADSGMSGIYDPATGQRIAAIGGSDFVCAAGAPYQMQRVYHYYNTATGANWVAFAKPRFEEVNGNEPSIQSLLAPAYGALAYANNLDGVPNGTIYSRTLAAYVSAGIPYNFQGAYSNTTPYLKGAEVSSGGNYWLCIANTTGNAPPNATYWQLLGPTSLDDVTDGATYARTLAGYLASGRPFTFQGAYSGSVTYHQGDEVSSGGNYYLYTNATATSGNIPPNSTYWQLLGPTTVDALIDGSTYIKMPSPPAVSGSGGQSLSQNGTTTAINVAAGTYYLGNKTVSVNAGSVDPGAYGTYWIYFDDPGFNSGAVTYQAIVVATGNYVVITQNPYRFYVGSIGTTGGGGATGGGTRGPCFSGDTRIRTPYGYRRFDELPERFEIVNRTGRHHAALLKHHEDAECRRMGPNHLVTAEHRIRVGDNWLPARELFYEEGPRGVRDWYNLHVFSDDPDDHHYILENGLTAHNPKP